MNTPRLLLVDDKPIFMRAMGRIFMQEGYEVRSTVDADRALEMVSASRFDAVFVETNLPLCDGLSLLERLLAVDHDASVVMMTSYPTAAIERRAMSLGAHGYVPKPVARVTLTAVAESAIRFSRRARHERALVESMARFGRGIAGVC